MKKTILTLLCMLAIGTLNAANSYRYHTKWISTASYWGSQSWRNYNYEGNSGSLFSVYYETEDDDSQEYWGSNGEGNWQKVRVTCGNANYKLIRLFITGPGMRNGSKADQGTNCSNGTLYYSTNDLKSGDNTYNNPDRATSAKSKSLRSIEWVGNSNDFTINKIDDNFRGQYFMIFYSKVFNASNFNVTVSAEYNPGGTKPTIKVVDKDTGKEIPASEFNWEWVAPCDGTKAGNYAGGIKITSKSDDLSGSFTADVVIKPADMSTVSVTSGSTSTPPSINWTGNQINPISLFTLKKGSTTLAEGVDYDWYITPLGSSTSPQRVIDAGRYTMVMTGKGNFSGTITRVFDVTKPMSMAESTSGIHFNLPEQILSGTALKEFNLEIKDTKTNQTLTLGDDYTVKYYACKGGGGADKYDIGAETTLSSINAEGKYWVKVAGKAPYYSGEINKAFYVVNEFQKVTPTTPTGMPEMTMHVTSAGYPVAAESPTGAIVPGTVAVSRSKDDKPAVAANSTAAKIPTNMSSTVADQTITFNVVGIQNNAFAGCDMLRWLDSDIPESLWTPSSLERKVPNTPFYGLPVHTLVYLNGSVVSGENYVYKIAPGNYRCEKYHIYEDLSSKQTDFSDD